MKIPVRVPKDKTLYEVLRDEGLLLSAYCGGRGVCLRCTVRLDGEEVLSCKTKGPLRGTVELKDPELVSPGEVLKNIRASSKGGTGLALDIGTTTVEGALFDLSTGKFIKSLKVPNLQSAFGADIVTRVRSARESYREERELLLESVELLLRELKAVPCTVCVSANPVMHHFMLGLSLSGFETYPFEPATTEAVKVTGKDLGIETAPDAVFVFPPLLGGFVGSDFLCGVLTLKGRSTHFGFADIGTNAEIGVRSDASLSASVPAGPALEGVGLFSGTRATGGAVSWAYFDGRTLKLKVLGQSKPAGICASGYIGILLAVKNLGVVDREGNFNLRLAERLFTVKDIQGEPAIVLYEDEKTIVALTQKDVRKILLAKAGVYGAVSLLMKSAGAVEDFFVSGALGASVSPSALKELRFIPPELPQPVPTGNTSLRGCSLLLEGNERLKEVERLRGEFKVVELGGNKEFEKLFVKGIELT